MSSYLCSKETISVVADVVSTNFNIEIEEAFNDLLAYNLENLKIRYGDTDWGQDRHKYVKVECSEAQKIKSIRNYLYQTDDYVSNDLIQWLQEYSEEHYHLIENATEKLYWDIEDRQYDEQVEETKTAKQLYFERGLDVKDIAKLIRKDLKKAFGKGNKFSVRISRFSGGQSIDVTAKEVTDDLLFTYEELCEKARFDRLQYTNPSLYEHLDKLYQERQFLNDDTVKRINDIVSQYNYNESDPYTDYYDVGFYSHIDDQVRT